MGRRMGWKPCLLRSARSCPISGIAQPSRWPLARTTWPAWLFCGGACCCTSSTTLPNSSSRKPRTAVARFTWTFVLLCIWLMAGAYLDSWHHHSLKGVETNFFTPYHAVLYSGMTAIGIYLALNVVRNYCRYGTWDELLPDGYGVSLLGTVLFGIGGVLDLLWHRRFGVEFSVAALFSPPHLFLMFTGGLIVSGPLRAAMRRGGNLATWPAIISGALTLSMLTFFLQFDQPLIDRWAAGTMPDARGPHWQ